MPARAFTRRSLLIGALGAGAGALVGRSSALASGSPGAHTFQRALGTVRTGVTRVELARNADLVGLQWRAPRDARIEISFRAARGRWSAWVPAGAAAHGPDHRARAPDDPRFIGEPLWTGGTTELALRTDRTLAGVQLHSVDVSAGVGERVLALAAAPLALMAALPIAEPVLAAAAGQPPIIARHAWARGDARPRVAPAYGDVRLAFVHHTENPNGYSRGEVPAMLRAIYAFHTYVNGWDDIGYNFVVDAYGRIFEARAGGIDEPVIGAHAGGYNYASTGVAVLGSFQGARISQAARVSLQRLLAWKLSVHGVAARAHTTVTVNRAGAVWSKYPGGALVTLPSIAGHRDADATECPGDALYAQLAHVRAAVHALAPSPTRVTLSLAPPAPGAPPVNAGVTEPKPPAPPSTPPAARGERRTPATPRENEPHVVTGAPSLLGMLATADGRPVAGAIVAIQARTVSRRGEAVAEQTLVQAQTGPDGAFTVTLAPLLTGARATSLRALYPGGDAVGSAHAGAAVSAPLAITPPPALSGG